MQVTTYTVVIKSNSGFHVVLLFILAGFQEICSKSAKVQPNRCVVQMNVFQKKKKKQSRTCLGKVE